MAARHARLHVLALATTALAVASCTPSKQAAFPVPHVGDNGVVIASTAMVPGTSTAVTASGVPDDCAGPGLAIKVQSATGSEKQLYDANGEPCTAAKVLFDGSTPLGQRAADPTVQIGFNDDLGSRPDPTKSISSTQVFTYKTPPAQPASTAAILPLKPEPVGPVRDKLTETLAQWQGLDDTAAKEAARAAARDLDNITATSAAESKEEAYLQLQARLREAERRVQEEERRRAEVARLSTQKRAQTEAEMQKWQAEQQELRAELQALQARASQYAQENQRLAREKEQQAQQYQAKIGTLSSDLKAAERQAEATRNKLILEAAAKIAEAEQLANAAKLQEQEIKLREAARLKTEAEDMMNRALAIKAGEGVPAPRDLQPAAAPMPLASVPVVLHARGKTLEELVTEILAKAAPQAGAWSSDWQLSQPNTYILNEKWSLTAEAPVAALLQQLAEQVKASHNINLTFTQFTTSRLLVVTDD